MENNNSITSMISPGDIIRVMFSIGERYVMRVGKVQVISNDLLVLTPHGDLTLKEVYGDCDEFGLSDIHFLSEQYIITEIGIIKQNGTI